MSAPLSGKIDLKGKVALVTGAARGIGKAIATALAREGADVIVSDILDLREAENAVKAMGKKALAVQCDISKREEANNLVQTALQQYGKIDIFVNSVGITGGYATPQIEDISEDEWDRIYNINVKGNYFLLQAIVPHMKEQNYGKIVLLSSLAARIGGVKSGAAYVSSKGAVMSLVKSMWSKVAPYSIYINAINPGVVETPILEDNVYPDSIFPMGRIGKPEDIAECAVFLCSQASNYITGMTFDVCGGFWVN